MTESEDELKSKISWYSLLSDLFAILIGVGLAADIFVIWYPLSECVRKGLGTAADVLIFLGVGLEVFFAAKAREKSEKLQILSDAKVEKAQREAKESYEELRKFRIPRHTLLDPSEDMTDATGVMSRMSEKLRRFAPVQFDTGLTAGPGEPMHFLWRLEKVLADAGWRHIDWPGSLSSHQGSPGVGRFWLNGFVWADDVEIHVRPDDVALMPAAEALKAALEEIGIVATLPGFGTNSPNANTIHIHVGLKQ